MKQSNIKKIDKFLEGFQEDTGCNAGQLRSVRKQIKRDFSRSLLTIDSYLSNIDLSPFIRRAKWFN